MIPLPQFLKSYRRQGEEFLRQRGVAEVQFSGGTYQVFFSEPSECTFLQLDERGVLKDSFCSCSDNEQHRGCVHQAAAFLHLYGSHLLPLHLRFERSFWNRLCFQCFDEVGGSPTFKKGKNSEYTCFLSKKQVAFSIKAKSKEADKQIDQLLFNRREETEETSLKFSNLSAEELDAWRRGYPSPTLSYELSLWSDLAKWLMALQERQMPYQLIFSHGISRLPDKLTLTFSDFILEWHLTKETLIAIIPTLNTVKASLVVHNILKEEVEKVLYDKQQHQFVLIPSSRAKKKMAKGVDVGDWRYVAEDGFYYKGQALFLGKIDLKDVAAVLNEHATTFKELLEGHTIKETQTPLSYKLFFDADWNFHIESYLFSPGDLMKAQFFGPWAYLEDRGFYRIEKGLFDEYQTVIPASDVEDFLSEHRSWINAQEGFALHVLSIQTDLTYQMDIQQGLSFSSQLIYKEKGEESREFGRWIYIQKQGFFSKTGLTTDLPIDTSAVIPPSHISSFIHRNLEELKLVNGFFSSRCPVEKVGLTIQVDDEGEINVTPEYILLRDDSKKEVHFFDDFTYVAGEGFYELPPHMRLPQKYRHPITVPHEQIESFIEHELKGLKHFITQLDPRLRTPAKEQLKARDIQYAAAHDHSGYRLELDYVTELGSLSLASLWNTLQRGERFLFSEAGLIDLEDKRYRWLKMVTKSQVDKKKNVVMLSALEFLRLNAFEEIIVEAPGAQKQQYALQLFQDLIEFKNPEKPDLTGLRSVLRPYQHLGVEWLWFLYQHGLSGLLCDDMGLGKTHQAMGLLAAIKNEWKARNGDKKCHFLVVCPTSVFFHWQEKLQEFLPDIKVWTYYGTKRSLEKFYEESDLLLTSYGIWRNEVKVLSKMPFEVAIFDELQIAKNQNSRIYNALQKATAKMRLGLTGTPIENRLRELKSLFDLILPTYMPPENEYREFFIRPIEKEHNAERRQLLSRLAHPMVLRRKKEDVLLDLPAKIEEISHCPLLPEQHKLYTDILNSTQAKILEDLHDTTTPIPYMHIFALLSHLKQVCNHPAAYLKKVDQYKEHQSGKWELFLELLKEARESGQKVVVFTQFLAMLDIMEAYLKEHHISYATIRGATRNRGEELRRFNYDKKCEIFIGSLQATGLGIDLTGGSVVIHYDRWWNAARENQATDRVHRIGQTRGVQVFKLVTKNTLEEHIDAMIIRKSSLLEGVLNKDNHEIIKKFDRQEMIELFQSIRL